MSTALAERPALDSKVIEQVLLGGDLSKLTADQRIAYYNRVCDSLGLNPLTQPFAYIRLNGKEVLYAKKDATEQLRKVHSVSILEVTSAQVGDVFVVTAKAQDKSGRTDASTGAVTIGNLKGDALANALMKAETKAKRRVTLSICGLGILDETELETVRIDPPVVKADPPALAPHDPLPLPEDVYTLREVRPQNKGNRQWAEVVLDTGEIAIAAGSQMVALLEQMCQMGQAMQLTIETNKKGHREITEAHRWPPAAPDAPPSDDELVF